MYNISEVLEEIPQKTEASPEKLEAVKDLLTKLRPMSQEIGLSIPHTKAVIIGIHLLAFLRRVDQDEYLPEIEPEMFEEISAESVDLSKRLFAVYNMPPQRKLDDAEVFFLAVHFEAAKTNL
ncbi:PRD domain-containing protein [Paenibacillus chitinolyticus]|uniref:hypothetical protein n=1 Tax=Paenibacillus chitinolyticus TaxID=79263 RepID=UPI002DB6163C|nr:hypothetical protein [Paenibacillus chitinolyticus]MEC0247007.1 PRD domain-containing protein [Paenibacillus chitinolyticus]